MQNSQILKFIIKITIIVTSFFIYYYGTSYLIAYRKSNSVRQAIFNAMDLNNDGHLSSKQIKSFAPCHTTYNKLNRKLAIHQRHISYSQFKNQATDTLLKKTFSQCSKNVPLNTNRTRLAITPINQSFQLFFGTYDINSDNIITWKEYHTINQFYKKKVKGQKRVFTFIDKNQDWRISMTQFKVSKFYKFLHINTTQSNRSNKTNSLSQKQIQNNNITDL